MTTPPASDPSTSGPDASGRPASGPPAALRIVVADDQASIREGLAIMLDLLPGIEVVATAADGEEALVQAERHRPDAVLMDLHMPRMDGIEATRRLAAEHPAIAVVVLTTYVDDASVLTALRAGARSYLTKDADRADIAAALHAARSGLAVLDPRARGALLAGAGAAPPGGTPAPPGPPPDGLTAREAEVLALVADGLSNQEIGAALFLSGNTVKTHINRIFAKTGCRDRVAAANYARRHGVAGPAS
ncbi:response regulator transcription factor [Kitasatospora purpeofusca]|uniref:response regulator transcription factor n=1 Tax=Kitasatospora purpeofusca TaxID=67352 RepID=UPI0030F1E433